MLSPDQRCRPSCAQTKSCLENYPATPDRDAQQTALGEDESLLRRFSLQQWLEVLRKVTYAIGGVIVFAAFRNSLTWHLQQFWGASGDFWQSQWGKIYTFFGEDDFTVGFYGTACVSFFSYWMVCLLFLMIDLTGRPAFIFKYKIQDDQNVPVPKGKLMHAIGVVLYNQVVVAGPAILLTYHLMQWRGSSFGRELPSIYWVMVEAVVFLIFEEIGFYYSHRIFHHPRVYRYIHKIHHEWTAPISVVALYCHPVEHLFANIMPLLIGPVVMGCHIATFMLWINIAQTSAIIAHCGYHLPFLPSPEAHDFHHLKFTNNFGTLGILDRLHGTDSLFRKTKQYQRHILLLGFTPVKHTVPDDPKEPRCD